MGKPNEDVDLTNSKGELVATLEANDDGIIRIMFWNPPQPNKVQNGSHHVFISKDSLTLSSVNNKSKIVFSFSEDESPMIQLFEYGKVIWSTAESTDSEEGKAK